jgi:RNA polymerase sigma factor (sigma-70 family)
VTHDRDPEAFRALYRAHYRAVCRYLAVRADAAVVEDVAAETFLVAWRRQHELPEHLLPWLLNTAAKCLANQRRSGERALELFQRLADAPAAGTPGPEEDLAREVQRRALLVALTALSERDRELLLLHHWDGLAPRQLAIVLELSPVAARARLHRAGRRLQQALRTELEREGIRPQLTQLPETT